MKKIVIMAFALFAVMACSEDDSRIFDKPANERIFENKKEFFNKLTNDNWIIELFPGATEDYGGFAIFADFSEDYKASLVNEEGQKAEGTAYDVVSRDGSLLTFGEYNEAMHAYSQPDINNPEGKYKTVDYEFIYVKSVGDILYTKGVKTSNSIRFVKTTLSPDEYFKKQAEVKNFIKERVAYEFFVDGKALDFQFGAGKLGKILSYVVTSVVEKEGKKEEEKEFFKDAFVYTDRGIRFYKNIEGTKVFELILDKENNVLKSEDGKVELKLFASPFNFTTKMWGLLRGTGSDKVKAAYEKMVSTFVTPSDLEWLTFIKDFVVFGMVDSETKDVGILYYFNQGKFQIFKNSSYKQLPNELNIVGEDGESKFYSNELFVAQQAFTNFILANSPYSVEEVAPLMPDYFDQGVKLTSKKDPSVWFILNRNK